MPEFETCGRHIAYEVVDLTPPWLVEPETLIFHHGVGIDRHLWWDWFPLLADRHRIVVFDMFGCGLSQPDGTAADWSAASRVDDLMALADAVGASRFHLVGESYGGTVAMMAALAAPERVATLTVCNAAHVGARIGSVAIWEDLLTSAGVRGWSDHMMGQRFFPGALDPARERWYGDQQATHSARSIREILRSLLAVDIAEAVRGIACPVLLLHGDASPFIPVSLMAELHERLPRSDLHVLAHARHGLPFSHAAACATALRAFLERSAS